MDADSPTAVRIVAEQHVLSGAFRFLFGFDGTKSGFTGTPQWRAVRSAGSSSGVDGPLQSRAAPGQGHRP